MTEAYLAVEDEAQLVNSVEHSLKFELMTC